MRRGQDVLQPDPLHERFRVQTGTVVVLVVVAAAAYAREITCRVLRRPCVCILVVVASRAAVRIPTVLSQ